MRSDQKKILVVDDEPTNLHLIRQTLQDYYQLFFGNDGAKAVEIAREKDPDLILLDVLMPEMGGYDACSLLKSDHTTQDIPVIFISSMDDVEDQDLGFKLGAVDYITKPIQPLLLRARVQNHLELKSARDKLLEQNRILQENMELRDDIERITQHDLKGPLNGIINYPNLVIRQGEVNEKQLHSLELIKESAYKILEMINLSMDMYKMEKGIYPYKPLRFDLIPVLDKIFDENQSLMDIKRINHKIEIDPELNSKERSFYIYGDPLLFYSMLGNTIKNAMEASPANETVTIFLKKTDRVTITVHNKGAVPEDIKERFFEKYVTAGKDSGTGLGTYSSRLMAETQKGLVHLKSSESLGTSIQFVFPIAPESPLTEV